MLLDLKFTSEESVNKSNKLTVTPIPEQAIVSGCIQMVYNN